MTLKNNESGTTYRNRLAKSVVLAIRKLMKQGSPDGLSKDLGAYVVLALEKMRESVDQTAVAWEKRDYWIKADHFRQEWDWLNMSIENLREALIEQCWDKAAAEFIQVGQNLSRVQVSEKSRIGEPWLGAWEIFSNQDK